KVHLNARQPRGGVVPIALVGPPAIHSKIQERLMRRPVTTHLAIVWPLVVGRPAGRQRWRRARVGYGSGKAPAFHHYVEHNLHVLIVQFLDAPLGIWKHLGIPGEFSVVSVPAVRTEVGAEINHSVARKLLLAEQFGFLEDLFGR